jgi:hypothetical protein
VRASQFFDDVDERIQALISRARIATGGLDKERFNRRTAAGEWSPAEVFQHMMIANKSYVETIGKALESARGSAADTEVKFSFIGKLIIKGAGPNGNAPALKFMTPEPGPYDLDLVDSWVAQHEEILSLLRKANGFDPSATRISNPFLPILKMNLADAFEIIAVHGERHVGQIEERVA